MSCLSEFAALGLAALLVAGCTHNYSFMLTPDGEPLVDQFPAVRAAATEIIDSAPGDFTLRVHFPPGSDEQAAELLELVEAPVRFLQQVTGRTPPGRASFYLAAWPEGQLRPHVQPQGPGVVTGVLFLRPARALLDVDWNRDWYYAAYPHELAHHFLGGLSGVDRWLSDGLPEYLAAEFARTRSEQAYLATNWWHPPLVALHRADLEPWTLRDFWQMKKVRQEDPALAFLLASRTAWRYAAAHELVRRWLRAASSRGIEAPLRDLLARVERTGARTLDDLRALAVEQTGRRLEELATVTPEERSSAARAAWSRLDHSIPAVRIHALRTLQFFGLPEGSEPAVLLHAVPPPAEGPSNWYLWHALGGALAASGDVQATQRFVEISRQHFDEDEARYHIPPAVWQTLLPVNPDEALTELVATINDPRVSLPVRDDANAILEAATDQSVGWRVDTTPDERSAAAVRWREALRPTAGSSR